MSQPNQRIPEGGRPLTQARRMFPIGREEFRAVWPFVAIAGLWVVIIYGLIIYESLFQLPLLAPVK